MMLHLSRRLFRVFSQSRPVLHKFKTDHSHSRSLSSLLVMSDDTPVTSTPPDAPPDAPQPDAPESPSPSDGQPLSKKAQKRLAKAAYFAEKKKERRAAEKERRKERKRALAEERAAGEDHDEDGERQRKRQKTERGPRTPFAARVVVDLGFDDKMTENVRAIHCMSFCIVYAES